MADFDECGMSVFGYGLDEGHDAGGGRAAARASSPTPRRTSRSSCTRPTTRCARARDRGEPGKPVVLADTQDNPGAGGNGDTTGLLTALIRAERAQTRCSAC